MSILYLSITTTDSNDTMNDSSRNLMHETNDNICIRENAKITQHDTEFENSDEVDYEKHLESPHHPIIAVNVVKSNARICKIKNALKGHTRSRYSSSFAPFDSNC